MQENFLFRSGVRKRDRGRVPHWETSDASYFVTFRLRDSLPTEAVVRLMHERARMLAKATNYAQKMEVNRAFGKWLDTFLDRGHGSSILRQHGGVVAETLKHFDGKRYELQAWCVMPNHVHVLVYVPGEARLDRILHSWKSYSAHAIGLGRIWAREYFDHIVRGEDEMERIGDYIRLNPLRAGLTDWPFVG